MRATWRRVRRNVILFGVLALAAAGCKELPNLLWPVYDRVIPRVDRESMVDFMYAGVVDLSSLESQTNPEMEQDARGVHWATERPLGIAALSPLNDDFWVFPLARPGTKPRPLHFSREDVVPRLGLRKDMETGLRPGRHYEFDSEWSGSILVYVSESNPRVGRIEISIQPSMSGPFRLRPRWQVLY